MSRRKIYLNGDIHNPEFDDPDALDIPRLVCDKCGHESGTDWANPGDTCDYCDGTYEETNK